jgi:hypothetical protein
MQRKIISTLAVLALLAGTSSPAGAQTYSDGQDVTGSPLDCLSSNRTLPTAVRGTGSEIRLRAQTENALADRSRVSTSDLYNRAPLSPGNVNVAPGELGFNIGFYTPSNTDGSSLPGSPNGVTGGAAGNAFLPLCALALTSDLASFEGRIRALEGGAGTSTSTRFANVELAVGEIARAAALAGVLDIAMPTNGRSNRLGVTVHDGYREEAIGVSYVRVQGPIDIGLAVGYSGGQSSGKASVGFSW